jgi:hypothetical protein
MAFLRNRGQLSIAEQLPTIQRERKISLALYRQLTTMLLANQVLQPEVRQQILVILDDIKLGTIRIKSDSI